MKNKMKNEHFHLLLAYISVGISILIPIFVFLGVIIRLFEPESEFVVQIGVNALRMFTLLSNILVAVCAILCIPYEIDAIRFSNLYLPRWCIYLLFMGVTCTSITFLIALTVLSPVAGFSYIMLQGTSLFLHTISPLLAIFLFSFITIAHKIKPAYTLLALAPVIIYAVVYVIEVFIIGEANGGWPDHYRLGVYLPWPVSVTALTLIYALVATGVRLLHNKMNDVMIAKGNEIIKSSNDLSFPTIEEAIANLAQKNKAKDNGKSNLTVPRRMIQLMKEKYSSSEEIGSLCKLYVENYYKV